MSKRVSLRQFQQELSNRLQLATSQSTVNSRLAIRVGNQKWLIDLADISEVIAPPPFASVPLTQPWFLGVTNIRGKLYSVVDLPAYVGIGKVQPHASNRLLMTHPRFATNSALFVDQALGLRNLDQMHFESSLAESNLAADCYRDDQGENWLSINMATLITDPAFLTVSA
ncbi:MAG TPA: chemotaxis protein CheW [Burkholderiales bacterium]|nr:chemotaxis protein CheW [Burkholderiales bacterium]